MLRAAFFDARYQIVGIQEGRSKTQTRKDGLHYVMYSAAGDLLGSFGVQCWIARTSGIQVTQWKVISTRLMYIIAATSAKSILIIVVAHAPHMGIEDDTKLSFWNQLWTVTSELLARHPQRFLVCFYRC